eukprot:c17336_g1_i3.p1 GENE.c17336_g1_i3~~c17336_g1_i3.p1  ORF type:complete len:129 (-),score=31.30 c17336_g1_i3:101-487(-)
MFDELQSVSKELYTQNGVLNMLARNQTVKQCPERFQETSEHFDIIITFEERVFDAVLEHFEARESVTHESVLVVNVPVKDSHEEATVGANIVLRLCQQLDAAEQDSWTTILQEFEETRDGVLTSFQFY